MSNSSPADLAVAFRSMPRRLSEAEHDGVTSNDIATASAAVEQAVGRAAAILRSNASADAVASAIQGRNAAQWTDDDLAAIQVAANDAAKAIRTLQNI